MVDVNFLGLREVQMKGLEGRLIYSNGTIMSIEFENERERSEFLRMIDSYTIDLTNVLTYVN